MYRNLRAETLVAQGLHRRAATVYRQDALSDMFSNEDQESALAAALRCERKANELRRARAGVEKWSHDIDGSFFGGRYNGYAFTSTLAMRGGLE